MESDLVVRSGLNFDGDDGERGTVVVLLTLKMIRMITMIMVMMMMIMIMVNWMMMTCQDQLNDVNKHCLHWQHSQHNATTTYYHFNILPFQHTTITTYYHFNIDNNHRHDCSRNCQLQQQQQMPTLFLAEQMMRTLSNRKMYLARKRKKFRRKFRLKSKQSTLHPHWSCLCKCLLMFLNVKAIVSKCRRRQWKWLKKVKSKGSTFNHSITWSNQSIKSIDRPRGRLMVCSLAQRDAFVSASVMATVVTSLAWGAT